MGAKFHTSPGVFLGRNHREVNKKQQKFDSRRTSQHPSTGSEAGKPGIGNIAESEEVMMIEETWMQPYLAYMINKTLPEDTDEARRIIQ
jgi:hypothetical protein